MTERHKLLLESPHLQEEIYPKLSSKSSSGSYILQITSLTNQYAASASSPSNVIDIFDKSTLRGIRTLSGHENGTTSLHTAQDLSGVIRECLVSSGKDGSVTVWDVRSNAHSIKMMTPGLRALLCSDISPDGFTIAAGSDLKGEDAFIFYWDPRQPATPIRTHSSTHSDDITTVSFLPDRDHALWRNILLSGSTDGLLCTSYADEDDEDEAIIHMGNWGSSISQAGWIHGGWTADPDTPHAAIWAATDMETFSTWTDELHQLMSVDIRAPSLRAGRTWSTDYLITGHSSATCAPKLSVFTGNNDGDVALLSNMKISAPDSPWCLHKLWKQGHSGIVRGLLWDESNKVLVTGGEDSKLNVWPVHPIVLDDEELDSEEDESSGQDVDEIMNDAVDAKMTSPTPRKRELLGGDERKMKRAKHVD